MLNSTPGYLALAVGCLLLAGVVDWRVSRRSGLSGAVGDVGQGMLVGAALHSGALALAPTAPVFDAWFILLYPLVLLAAVGFRARATGAVAHRRAIRRPGPGRAGSAAQGDGAGAPGPAAEGTDACTADRRQAASASPGAGEASSSWPAPDPASGYRSWRDAA